MKTPGPTEQLHLIFSPISMLTSKLGLPETTLSLAQLLPGDKGQVATQAHQLTIYNRDRRLCCPHSEAVTSPLV